MPFLEGSLFSFFSIKEWVNEYSLREEMLLLILYFPTLVANALAQSTTNLFAVDFPVAAYVIASVSGLIGTLCS